MRALRLIPLAVVLFAARAEAYPQWQFSSGTTRCNECHYAPAGGGLINSWGRSESADTLSRGGNGGFLHGLVSLPAWIALGADFRIAGLYNDVKEEKPQVAVFPMQGDIYLRLQAGAFSLYGIGGGRAIARNSEDKSVGAADRYGSREHFLMWRPDSVGPYVRVGRFFAPYGLRQAEHIYYVRRFTGFGLLEESYAASVGLVEKAWELHATVFAPAPESYGRFFHTMGLREAGGAALFEKRFEIASVGLQTRVGIGDEESRYQGGAIGKVWIERAKILLMGEGDFVRQTFKGSNLPARNQFVGFVGLTWFPIQGLNIGVNSQQYDEDLKVKKTERLSVGSHIGFYPTAHVEIVGYTRLGDSTMAMLQLHYYL